MKKIFQFFILEPATVHSYISSIFGPSVSMSTVKRVPPPNPSPPHATPTVTVTVTTQNDSDYHSLLQYQKMLAVQGVDLATSSAKQLLSSPAIPAPQLDQSSPSKFTEYFSRSLAAQEALETQRSNDLHAVFERINQRMSAPESDEMDIDEPEDDQVSSAEQIRQLILQRKLPIPDNEHAKTVAILRGPASDEVLIEKFNIDITRYKIVCLKPATWLNDEAVNFYMCMLQELDEKRCKMNPNRLPSHYFNSFFMSKLLENEVYNYKNVKRWTKKFDIESKDKIFFPVNIHNTHWTLAVVYMQKKEIHYYDSMSGSGRNYLNALLKWVVDDIQDKKSKTLDPKEWKLLAPSAPQQRNGYDCGVFTITCADYITDNLPINEYDQADINSNRVKFAAAILRGSVNYA